MRDETHGKRRRVGIEGRAVVACRPLPPLSNCVEHREAGSLSCWAGESYCVLSTQSWQAILLAMRLSSRKNLRDSIRSMHISGQRTRPYAGLNVWRFKRSLTLGFGVPTIADRQLIDA